MQQNNNKIYFLVSILKTVCFLIGDLQIKYHTHKGEKNYGCKKRRNRNLCKMVTAGITHHAVPSGCSSII